MNQSKTFEIIINYFPKQFYKYSSLVSWSVFALLTFLARPYLRPFTLETLTEQLKTQQKQRKNQNGCSSQSGKPRKLLSCVLVMKVVGFQNAEISAFSYSSLEYPAPIYQRRRANLVKGHALL